MDPIVRQTNPIHSYHISITSILTPSPIFKFISYFEIFWPKFWTYKNLHHVMKYQSQCPHNPIYFLNVHCNTILPISFLPSSFQTKILFCTRTYTTSRSTNQHDLKPNFLDIHLNIILTSMTTCFNWSLALKVFRLELCMHKDVNDVIKTMTVRSNYANNALRIMQKPRILHYNI